MSTNEWRVIANPEELFRLLREDWEIVVRTNFDEDLEKWSGLEWKDLWQFRARPRQPKMKKVKLLAYLDLRGELRKLKEGANTNTCWTHVPSEDKEIEIPDDN